VSVDGGRRAVGVYTLRLSGSTKFPMEAERINAIAASLADLAARAAELRRYL